MRKGTPGSQRSGRRARPAAGALLTVVAGLAAAAGLTGCSLLAPPDQDPGQNPSPDQSRDRSTSSSSADAAPSAPVDLAQPIELAIVTETGQPPCSGDYLPSPEQDECLLLGDGIEVTELEELTMATPVTPSGADSGEQVLNLTLTDADGEAFYDLTARAAELPHPRLAILVDGDVVSAPTLAQPIPGGMMEIAGWDGAEDFVADARANARQG